MELSAPLQRPLPSPSPLSHRRPFLPTTTTSPSLLVFSRSFPVSAPKKKSLASRSISELGRSGARFRRVAAFEEENSSTAVASGRDDDAAAPQKRIEGPSFTMVSPAEDDSGGGADGVTGDGQPEAGEDLLSKLNFPLDLDDAPTILFYGSGALLALWLSASVISALDSVPVFPKVMEVVGLGFTIWFSSRYLIFKKNRDELFAKLQELKEQILGSE